MKFFLILLIVSQILAQGEESKISDKVSLQISIDDQPEGIILLGLFGDVVPRTVDNFKTICTGTKVRDGVRFAYEGTIFHRIIPNFMIQGGDFTKNDGTGGESIFGAKFADENFQIPTFTGCLAMANAGPNTNGSQFFITTASTAWLNGKHVVFGKVIDGMDIVKKIESFGSDSGTPSKRVSIQFCQVL